jgi:dihydrolipoamide dehydrogenase
MPAKTNKQPAVVVIGGGPGGYVAAIEAAREGAAVTIVEKMALGGTCVNQGCVPTKALIRSAQLYDEMTRAEEYGISVREIRFDYKQMAARKNRVVEQLRNGVAYLMKKNKITVIEATATIVAPGQVRLSGPRSGEITADHIIIATGSVPGRIPVPGADLANVINSDQALELDRLPQSIIIIGGGVIGLEFAHIYRRLNVEVSVIEMLQQLLPAEDPAVSTALEKVTRRQGISVYTGTTVEQILTGANGQIVVRIRHGANELTLEAEKALVATGRKPYLNNLGLEQLGIQTDQGRIVVDNGMRTNVPGIYAIGDAVGGLMLAHKAMAEGRCASRNAIGRSATMDYKAIPRCIWTAPEVASVGLTESEANQQYPRVCTADFPFSASGKAKILGATQGLVKIVAAADTEEVLGVHMLGPHATELIAEAVLGLNLEVTLQELGETIHAHPTLSETVMESALAAGGHPLHL